MRQKDQPGYPLPEGELGEDEIICQLVFLPDRPEYWQAFLGAYSYMCTWRAWERDDDKRGKDAAANWREAFELTIGCWRMACLEELQENIEAIRILLENKKDCCDDAITYLPGDEVDTDIDPGVGDPPDFYGETEVEDWDEWNQYLCNNAHKYVDYLAHVGDQMLEAATAGSMYIGLVAAGLMLLAASGIGLPVAFVIAAAITSALVISGTLLTFDGSKDAIEDARYQIVCAIMNNYGLAAAVEDALSSGTDWDLFYQFVDYDTAIAILYEGGHEGEYLPAQLLDDCSCECLHFVDQSGDPANTINDQDSSGANVTMTRRELWGAPNVIYGQFSFNQVQDQIGWCGPMKVIDTISVSDGLKFAVINIYDQDSVLIQTWTNSGNTCQHLIGELVGKTFARFNITRFAGAQGGCGAGAITVTMTYHDAV